MCPAITFRGDEGVQPRLMLNMWLCCITLKKHRNIPCNVSPYQLAFIIISQLLCRVHVTQHERSFSRCIMHYYTVCMMPAHCHPVQTVCLPGSEKTSSHIRGKQLFSKGSLNQVLSLFPFLLFECTSFIRAGDLKIWNTSSGHLPVGRKGPDGKDRHSLTFKKWLTLQWQETYFYIFLLAVFKKKKLRVRRRGV